MRLLFIADIFGRPGREAVESLVPRLREELDLDLVVANGENAADGAGITDRLADKILASGVDCITLGNHTWHQRGFGSYLDTQPRIVRPANYLASNPGRGVTVVEARDGTPVAVVNLMGRLFVHPEPSCSPFEIAAATVAEAKAQAPVVLVDFHAEATSEKVAMGRHLAGRVTAASRHAHPHPDERRVALGRHRLSHRLRHDRTARLRDRRPHRDRAAAFPDAAAGSLGAGARRRPHRGRTHRVRSRQWARDPNRDVPAAGVSAFWARPAVALAVALALAVPATAHGRTSAVIVQVRPSPAPLLPVARSHVATLLRERARRDQAPLMRFLRAAVRRGAASDVESLWIADSIALRAQPELIAQLRRRADVRAVEPDREIRLERTALAPSAVIPGTSVAATGAPQMWAQGQTGRGAVVAVIDTGLVAGFPQLSTAAGSWFDPYDQHATPFDESGHGTEVAEVVVSMAPDVRILAARVFSDGGRSTTSAVHRVFEWALDPDGNPRTSDAPSVLNGSWDDGGPGHCETEFNRDLAALRAAGIVPVFAAGNSGPGASTGASPASAPGAVAVGSVTTTDVVSSFSGRGPSTCSSAIFPTIAAYGDGIAVGGPGGETVVQGTSFAAPQVTGAVALLTAMYPGATPEAIIDALVRGARDVGAPGADTDTGAGILNVAQAAALLAGADHAGPRVNLKARWSKDADHLGLVLTGRAHERGGGTSDGVKASAFISRHGIPASTFPLSATPLDPTFAALSGHRHATPGAAPGRRPAHPLRARARRRRQLGAGPRDRDSDRPFSTGGAGERCAHGRRHRRRPPRP